MPYTFELLCEDVVKKLQGKDLEPVKRLSDASKFRQFEILQNTDQSWFWKSEDIPVGYSLLQILEPNVPVPEPEVSDTYLLKHTVSQKGKVNMDFKAIAEGSTLAIAEGSVSAGFGQSCGYDIEVQKTSLRGSELESLQNRKLVDREPQFMKECRESGANLYVVTETFEVTRDTVLEETSSTCVSGKLFIPNIKSQAHVLGKRERTDSVTIQKGTVVAYKKKQLVIQNNTCVILLSANAKKKTFL